ncbi:hypothetical protein [Hymenobacter sp. 102]
MQALKLTDLHRRLRLAPSPTNRLGGVHRQPLPIQQRPALFVGSLA